MALCAFPHLVSQAQVEIAWQWDTRTLFVTFCILCCTGTKPNQNFVWISGHRTSCYISHMQKPLTWVPRNSEIQFTLYGQAKSSTSISLSECGSWRFTVKGIQLKHNIRRRGVHFSYQCFIHLTVSFHYFFLPLGLNSCPKHPLSSDQSNCIRQTLAGKGSVTLPCPRLPYIK